MINVRIVVKSKGEDGGAYGPAKRGEEIEVKLCGVPEIGDFIEVEDLEGLLWVSGSVKQKMFTTNFRGNSALVVYV